MAWVARPWISRMECLDVLPASQVDAQWGQHRGANAGIPPRATSHGACVTRLIKPATTQRTGRNISIQQLTHPSGRHIWYTYFLDTYVHVQRSILIVRWTSVQAGWSPWSREKTWNMLLNTQHRRSPEVSDSRSLYTTIRIVRIKPRHHQLRGEATRMRYQTHLITSNFSPRR